MEISSAVFVTSAPDMSKCPDTGIPEFAFVGRSNVGKSTLINMITRKNQLAKASNVPGKTQLINYFLINDSRYLVDLPWYGYARYGTNKRIQWMDTMQEYLTQRNTLKKIFVLVDGSIPPQKIDLEFMYVLFEERLDFSIVVTKTDKIKAKELNKNVSDLKRDMERIFWYVPELFLTSAEKQTWRKDLVEYLFTCIESANSEDDSSEIDSPEITN